MTHYKIIDGKRYWYGEKTHYNQGNKSNLGHHHTEEFKNRQRENSRKLQKQRRGFTDENGNRRWLYIGQEVPEGWTPGWPERPQEFKELISEITTNNWKDPEIREKMIKGLRYGNSRSNY